ncbi:MAG: ATP-binding cassette domain-containing protein [Dehalococcoidia bacterium]|nr:ATP-binding cassette domain-containing protein [Dehalococcoidia bacterium]
MKAIVTDNLTKMFGHLVAVDHISFEVEEGEMFGCLGANGAGKTSTVMMLATALNPSSGTATVCGYDIIRERDKVRESIGIVFEDLSLDTNFFSKMEAD